MSALLLLSLAAMIVAPLHARAIREGTAVWLRQLSYVGQTPTPRDTGLARLAWEMRQRTSVDVHLDAPEVSLTDPTLFDSPFLFWHGDHAFAPLSEAEISALRRFVELGGFVLIDDNSPRNTGFDVSVRRELARAFPDTPLHPLASSHTIYHSFYLIDRPIGREAGPGFVEAIDRHGRAAVIYARIDLAGALARDNAGAWIFDVAPGGDPQREQAIRLGVNLVQYALCLDYKDDQVHAPFIMRRRGGRP